MAHAPLVIDTNTLNDKRFRRWLRSYHGEKLLPSNAYAEYGVVVERSKKQTFDTFNDLLRRMGVTVEWFRREQAELAARIWVLYGDEDRLWGDFLIASHAIHSPRIMVTWNIKDFKDIVYLEGRLLTPDEVMGIA